jgi:2-polyprenyl-3-methyl-5-hydroxy-6-metoxy-1,4-benzoquinol methylase
MKLLKSIKKLSNPCTEKYWDKVYASEISQGIIKQDKGLLKIIPLLKDKKNILDFGSGLGGNIKLLADKLRDKKFFLIDHSIKAIEFARKSYLGNKDIHGNFFYYFTNINSLPGKTLDAILSIEVLEHIKEYQEVLDNLWNLLEKQGILIISVPVKGWRDRHREHVNKFTIKTMFQILSKYSEWVHISPRTYSSRSGILATTFFYIIKK